jgi:hypothetical protein
MWTQRLPRVKIHKQISNLTLFVWMFLHPTNKLLNFLFYFVFNLHLSTLHLHNKKLSTIYQKTGNWNVIVKNINFVPPYDRRRVQYPCWRPTNVITFNCLWNDIIQCNHMHQCPTPTLSIRSVGATKIVIGIKIEIKNVHR